VNWSDVLDAAGAFFLVLVGLTLAYALVRVAATFTRLTQAVDESSRELVPLLSKANETLDHVNVQLADLERITRTAADTVEATDRRVRTVMGAVTSPVSRLSGAVAGIESGLRSFTQRRRRRRGGP
jgi:uncharacterized protein YoxC